VNIKLEPQQQPPPQQQQQQQTAAASAAVPPGVMESAVYVDSTTFPALEPLEVEYSLEEIGNGTKY
jgi:hypothetical protein